MTTQTINPVPTAGSNFLEVLQDFLRDEDAARTELHTPFGFVASGGVHGPVAGLTATPSALVAFPAGYYTTETGSITYADNSTTWVIAHFETTGNLGAYIRVAGTHYLTAVGAVAPALPNGCVRLMRVVTAGGAVTSVQGLVNVSPLQARGTNPFVRLIGTEPGGLDYDIQEVSGDLVFGVNVQTQDNPSHAFRFTFRPSNFELLLISGVTTARAQTFPDKDGTFAMLSDIAGSAFAPGTRMLFDQDAAPAGWVRDVVINDRVVRIVSGARVDGGSWSVSGFTASGHAITIAEMPSHTHDVHFAANAAGGVVAPGGDGAGVIITASDATGGSQQHTHNVVNDSNWRPLHRDVIVCQKS